MKKKIPLILLVLFFVAFLLGIANGFPGKYVASKLRHPFHYPSCEWAPKIDFHNMQWFQTRQEAIRAGHRPCKVCNP